MRPGAVVLCGGESRRMGRPKAWLPFGPERLLQRVVRLVGTVARSIVVVAAPGQDLPDLPADVAIVRDPIAGRGPLQGLAAGLAGMPEPADLVYATATDVPFLEPRWITLLVELIDVHDLAIPSVGERYHPLAALYRRESVLPVIDRLLREDRLRLQGVVELVRARVVREEELIAVDPRLGALRNLNHPEDYEEALRDAGFMP
jgi:molybdopterin-guanine dinucleotide biosynthesis protein A